MQTRFQLPRWGVAVAAAMCLSLTGVAGCSKSEAESSSKSLPEGPRAAAVGGRSVSVPEGGDIARNPNAVLRHAVFFRFKEESSKEDVKKVVDAFRALPDRVPEIIEFEWGEDNSPEGKADGFTHCFRLTFKDDAGRKVYLPHDAHKEFGDVLRPHMADVFVIDYWGHQRKMAAEELRHMVFFKFKEGTEQDKINEVISSFSNLRTKIDVIKAFEWGENNSPEKHDDGYTHAFAVTFDSEEGRETYLPHEKHQEFVKLVGPLLESARVLDYWVQK